MLKFWSGELYSGKKPGNNDEGQMMEFETIIYEKEKHIATLTLNRPEKGNAISRKLRD